MMPNYEQIHTLCHMWKLWQMGRKRLVAFQNRKLRAVIGHAYNNVRYYRRLFDHARLKPEDIHGLENLDAVPISSSRYLKKCAAQDLLSRGRRRTKLVSHKTSGSSGRPFVVRRSVFEEHLLNMFRIRAMRYLGLKVSDWISNIAMVTPAGHKNTGMRRLKHLFGIYRHYPLDIFQTPENIAPALDRLAPAVFVSRNGCNPFRSQATYGGFPENASDIFRL